MNRKDFLKKLGIGLCVGAVAPKVLDAFEEKPKDVLPMPEDYKYEDFVKDMDKIFDSPQPPRYYDRRDFLEAYSTETPFLDFVQKAKKAEDPDYKMFRRVII